jgi:hypothetical protein
MQFFLLLPNVWINPDQIVRFALQSSAGKEVVEIRFSDGSTETLTEAETIKKFMDKFNKK